MVGGAADAAAAAAAAGAFSALLGAPLPLLGVPLLVAVVVEGSPSCLAMTLELISLTWAAALALNSCAD